MSTYDSDYYKAMGRIEVQQEIQRRAGEVASAIDATLHGGQSGGPRTEKIAEEIRKAFPVEEDPIPTIPLFGFHF